MTARRRPRPRRGLLAALATVATLATGLPLQAVTADLPPLLAKLQVYPVAPPTDGPRRPTNEENREHQARRAVSGSPFLDPDNGDLRHLQRYEDAVAHLPKDANGFPDWMRALREGAIAPRGSLSGALASEVLDLDIVMRNTKEMPWVRFPHRAHTEWLACANCHPRPFEPRAGATRMQMADIFRGQYCGMCHDRVAFITFFSCTRCHSVPQATAPR